MEKFLNKYTRFMSKDIYISYTMYSNFLSQYDYLYQELERTSLLYQNHLHYKKVMDIKKNKEKLIRFHNEKYLKKKSSEYQTFFGNLYDTDQLSTVKRHIICCEEEDLLVVSHKENIPFITAKVKYLVDIKKMLEKQILVLTNEEHQVLELQSEFQNKGIHSVLVMSLKEYSKTFLGEKKIVEEDTQYQIFSSYLIEEIFPKKEKFERLYLAFQNYIYLNKDYKDFDTFHDYHNYMYKRKFLSSKKSLKKYNEQEIKKRSIYLRTICNEIVNTKEEVDIANFLYLNSCSYHYDKKNSCFIVTNDKKKYVIFYQNELKSEQENNSLNDSDDFVLYAKYFNQDTYLEVLAYELIKRRYPMELRSDEEVYEKLKDTTIDSYFVEFITKCLIPAVTYYKKHSSFSDNKLTKEQIQILMEIYSFYQEYLEEHNFMEEENLMKLMENSLNNSNYRYLILLGDISLTCTLSTFKIISDYQEFDLLKDTIKLSYDYKKYLYEHKVLPFFHVYRNDTELHNLTTKFLKENLMEINQKLASIKKKVSVYFYEDSNRLLADKNMSVVCHDILREIPNQKQVLIGLLKSKDINHMIESTYFKKEDKSHIVTRNKRVVSYGEIFNQNKNYDTILLPYFIMDRFHENLFQKDEFLNIKLVLSVALSTSKDGIFILCPSSRKEELKHILEKLKNVFIYE